MSLYQTLFKSNSQMAYQFHNLSRPNLGFSQDPFLLTIPGTRSKSGNRTFTVTASTELNNTPSFITANKSTDQKDELETKELVAPVTTEPTNLKDELGELGASEPTEPTHL